MPGPRRRSNRRTPSSRPACRHSWPINTANKEYPRRPTVVPAASHILDDLTGPMGRTVGVIPVNQMVDKSHAAVDARSDMVVTVRRGAGRARQNDRQDGSAGRRSVRGPSVLLSSMVSACRVRRFKYPPGLVRSGLTSSARPLHQEDERNKGEEHDAEQLEQSNE